MSQPLAEQVFSKPMAIGILAALACTFAANQIAARIAFEHSTGLALAILCRSGVSVLLLSAVLLKHKPNLETLSNRVWPWQLGMGLLISIQSFCIYSAISRMPVGIALLLVNIHPLLLIFLTWLLGGPAPTRRMLGIMAIIITGLVMALDLPAQLSEQHSFNAQWIAGAGFSLGAAFAFACAVWITSHRLAQVSGTLRSWCTMFTVFVCSLITGVLGFIPNGLHLPDASAGWIGLSCLAVFYGSAFAVLFAWIHRLHITRYAAVMNMEPVAALFFAWLILGQEVSAVQILGAAVVIIGIVFLTRLPD